MYNLGMKKKKDKFDYKNYHRDNYTSVTLHFNKESDREVLEYLKEKENKTDFVRKLILKDKQAGASNLLVAEKGC